MTAFFGRKTNSQRTLSRLMMTSALVAAGTMVLSSSAFAADPWADVTGSGFTNTSGGANTTNIAATTANGKATGRGNLDILEGQTVNIDAKLFVAYDNRTTIQTSILGHLNSNGTVVLVDRNGVLFGKNSVVNVGSLIASTGYLDTVKALGNNDDSLIFSNFGTADIVNNGSIQATGLVAFVAPTVRNAGVINANLGKVSLDAGNTTATVDLYGDGLVEFAPDTTNTKLKFLSENTGSITAGKIQMTAAAASSVVNSVVNMQGVLTANSAIVNAKGEIVLSAGKVVLGSASVKSPAVKGNTKVTATQLELGLTIDGDISGSSKTVNVLSTKAKIAQGLTAVAENGTVNVAAGTYNEHLVLDKAGVTLNGANAGKSANGTRGAETIINPNSPGIEITADGVTVDGLTFADALSSDGYGIFVNGADDVTLQNNIIRNTAQSGIYALGASGLTVANNNIGGTGVVGNIGADGIHLLNTTGALITGNNISNTTSPKNEIGSGVFVENSSGTVVDSNVINNVAWDGVKVLESDDTIVNANTISNTGRAGVAVSYSAGTMVLSNVMNNLARWGVWSTHNEGTLIGANFIKTVGAHGIFSDLDTDTAIAVNQISGVKHDGIVAQNSSGAMIIFGNNVGGTGAANNIKGNGISVYNADGAIIDSNTVANVQSLADYVGSGIYVQQSNDVTINNNDVYKVGWDGIRVDGGDNYQITDNKVTTAGRAGIAISNTTNSTVEGNKLTDLKVWGIWSTLNGSLDIFDNAISYVSQRHGIISSQDNDLSIDGNTIIGTLRDGVHIVEGTGVSITDNNIGATGAAGNIQGDGVNIYLSDDVTVSGNTIANVISRADEMGSGVYSMNSDNVTISGNTIYNVGWDGVKVKEGDDVVVSGNTISNTGRSAVAASYATNVSILGNIANNMGAWGVWSTHNDGIEISGNDLKTISAHGIFSDIDTDIVIDGNTVAGVKHDGIHVQKTSGSVEITNNKVGSTGAANNIKGDGIYLNDADGALVDGNIVANIQSLADFIGSGIYAENSDDVTVTNNTIYKTGWDGIKVRAGDNFYVAGNMIHDTGRAGVAVSEATNSTVENNTMYNLKLWGVWSTLNDGLDIAGNTMVCPL